MKKPVLGGFQPGPTQTGLYRRAADLRLCFRICKKQVCHDAAHNAVMTLNGKHIGLTIERKASKRGRANGKQCRP